MTPSVMMMGDEGKEGVDEGDSFGWGLEHLPVGGDQGLTHIYQYSVLRFFGVFRKL